MPATPTLEASPMTSDGLRNSLIDALAAAGDNVTGSDFMDVQPDVAELVTYPPDDTDEQASIATRPEEADDEPEDEPDQSMELESDKARQKLIDDTSTKDAQRNAQLADGYRRLTRDLAMNPIEAMTDFIADLANTGIVVDVGALARHLGVAPKANVSDDAYDYGMDTEPERQTVATNDPEIAALRRDIRTLMNDRETKHVDEVTAARQAQVKSLQDKYPRGDAVTYEQVDAYARHNHNPDYEAAFKSLYMDRETELRERQPNAAAQDAQQMLSGSRGGSGTRRPRSPGRDFIKNVKSFDPAERYSKDLNDIIQETKIQVGIVAS